MEDHPLLRTLAKWQGRGPTQRSFEALGFSLHKAWQNRMLNFCGEQRSLLINRYWDEVAIETMLSLGQGDPDQRVFAIKPEYRSALLDELFAARDFVELPFRYPPLVKCLFEYSKKIYVDLAFREQEMTFFRNLQNTEGERLGIQTAGWTGKKRDVVPIVDQFCTALAFERRRNRWRKVIEDNVVFEVGVDTRGSPLCITPPLVFSIFHVSDPQFVFEINGAAVLDRFVPGVRMYARCGDARQYVLGVKALVELFGVICHSFKTK